MTAQFDQDVLSLQDVEVRIEELNKIEILSEDERQEFIDLALRRMEILDELHYQRTGRWPIL